MSGNQNNFDVITQAVADVRDWYGTTVRDGDYRARLLAEAVEANGGRRTAMVDRIVEYQCTKVGRGTIMTAKGPQQGRGVHAKCRERDCATWMTRREVTYQVGKLASGFLGRGEPIPSARRVRQILRDREFPCGETAIRTGLRAIPEVGTPIITRNRRALSRPAQDLIEALEESLAKSALHVVSVWECHRKLYAPSSNSSTQRSQKRRLDAVLAELEAASRIGISIKREGDSVFVGRGRAVPASTYKWEKRIPVFYKALTPGIVNGRAGLWASPEGQMAYDLALTTTCLWDEYIGQGTANLFGIASSPHVESIEEDISGMMWSARQGVYNAAEMRRGAENRRVYVDRCLVEAEEAIEKIRDGLREDGLTSLWRVAQEWPGLKAKAHDPAAQRRIARIAQRFSWVKCPEEHIQLQRLRLALWLDTPKALRSPNRPLVDEYRSPELLPAEDPASNDSPPARKRHPSPWAEYRKMYPAPALVSRG